MIVELFIFSSITILSYFRKELILVKLIKRIKWIMRFVLKFFKLFFMGKSEDLVEVYINLTRKLGSPNKFNYVYKHVYVDRPDDLQILLNSPSCLAKGDIYDLCDNKTGLITAAPDLWKVHRKLLNPSFNNRILQSFIPIFNQKSDLLINNFSKHLKNEEFDVYPYFSQLTLDMICATSFGWESGVQNGKHREYLEAVENITEILFKRLASIWYHSKRIYQMSSLYQLEKKYFDKIHEMTYKVISFKKENHINEQKVINYENENDDIKYEKPQIFINQLFKLSDKEQMNDVNLVDHCDTMIGAGTDTTATTLANAILMLAMHPDIQKKVVEELQQNFVKQKSFIDYDDIKNLVYLEMVLKETLRLWPTIPAVARQTTAKITLTNNFIIDENTNVFILFYNLHRNPLIWGPNFNKFNPNNFLTENVAKRHPYSFLPFSGGPRNCIGLRYSMIAMKITLANLLRQYEFTTNLNIEDIKLIFGITSKLSTKRLVQISRREFFPNT